jgi:hypothetical protein
MDSGLEKVDEYKYIIIIDIMLIYGLTYENNKKAPTGGLEPPTIKLRA